MHSIITQYYDLGALVPPASDVLASACGGGRLQVKRVVDFLRDIEAQMAQALTNKQFCGVVEIDEHGAACTTHIIHSSPNFEKSKIKKGQGKPPPYWRVYARVIGLRRRGGGRTIAKALPHKLVRPGAKPPPCNNEELVNNGMMVLVGRGSVVFRTVPRPTTLW